MTAADLLDLAIAPVAGSVGDPIPGAVLGVVTGAGDRAVHAVGLAQREPVAAAMGRGTWFDLASLTKVLFTTPTILRLAAQGLIALDDPLTVAIPDLRQYDPTSAERRLTFRQCLSHQTHLPAVEPLYTYGQDPATLRAFILQRVWQSGPPVYSDINFMLLGIAIERLTGCPLGEQTLPPGFCFSPDPAECAATERCTWRGRVLRGEVHDENAFALGGAAGHAGLFGTVDGVLDAAQHLLQDAEPALAATRTRQSATRTLGWEARHDGWSGGDACSADTIGHTGFTGTGVWIDHLRGRAWTLLTNRVHPTRHRDSGIVALRRRVGDLIAAAATAALLLCAVPSGAARAADPMASLLRAYPDALEGFDGTDLIWRDGTRMPVGDGRPDKSLEQQLHEGSILDQLRLVYPAGAASLPIPPEDPGRVRNRAFFTKMYGDCRAGEVAPKLAHVVWLPRTWGHTVSITSVNGVDHRLAAISRELDKLPDNDKRYLYPPGGTYVCRAVADTGEPSMHAWGAAIDINPARSHYWLWRRTSGALPAYINTIPQDIVTIFERHGFIWGGRWAHFDTMHFEYRPELLGYDPKADDLTSDGS